MSTETTIDLTKFCSTKNGRYDIPKPFVLGGWRYATNGRIAVRTPAPNEPDDEIDGQLGKAVPQVFADAQAGDAPWHPLASLPTEVGDVECDKCEGGGRVNEKVCPRCDGNGGHNCCECGQQVDCKFCNAEGRVGGMKCPDCLGVGRFTNAVQCCTVGKGRILQKNRCLLLELPNILVREPASDTATIWFTFDGGEGVVAGFRKHA